MDTEMAKIYEKLLSTYSKTGYIGKTKPYNLEYAKRQAYAVAQSILKRRK